MKLTSLFHRKPEASPGVKRNFEFLQDHRLYHNIVDPESDRSSSRSSGHTASKKALNELLSKAYFHQAANMAAKILIALEDPTDPEQILELFYTRLVCLLLVGLKTEAAIEGKALKNLGSEEEFWRDANTNRHIAPWELRVLEVRLGAFTHQSWDECLGSYFSLIIEARREHEHAAPSEKELWKQRAEELAVRISHAYIEKGDVASAAKYLEAANTPPLRQGSLARSEVALMYLRLGDRAAGRNHCLLKAINGEDLPMSTRNFFDAMCPLREARYREAEEKFIELQVYGLWNNEFTATINQSIAVCQFFSGRIAEVRKTLSGLAKAGHSLSIVCGNMVKIRELIP